MRKPKKNVEYKCPYGKTSYSISRYGQDEHKDVSASYCKNNCSLYKKNKCKLFKRKKLKEI